MLKYSTKESEENCESEPRSQWLLNCHHWHCSSWRLWYLSSRFDDGSGYMGNHTEDAKRDDKDDIYFLILLLLVAFYVKKNI